VAATRRRGSANRDPIAHADPYSVRDADAVGYDDANRDTQPDTDRDAYGHADSHGDRDRDRDGQRNCHTDASADPAAYEYADGHTFGGPQADTVSRGGAFAAAAGRGNTNSSRQHP
jgi:hypothetical protein